MKTRESFSTKFIKYFYGIDGELDEYRRSELNRIGNNAYMILFYYLLVSTIVVELVGRNNFQSLQNYLFFNLLFLMLGSGMYTVIAIHKLKLNITDVSAMNYKDVRRMILKRDIRRTVICTMIYCIFYAVGMHKDGVDLMSFLVSLDMLMTASIFATIFGFFSLVIDYSHLRRYRD
ncbi:DUF3278 domain-containing protein [Companilactobacillus jidongensis]|uniref:DUF3278 domain-containing protein n=1 Tax=Companilactobacillus jidongensis TaxID=2486006 RepID=UPI000F7987C1|nr:DUF3278 domain-containing protein [Companilactobacillus jidongensis]